jgi:hypothetical protein
MKKCSSVIVGLLMLSFAQAQTFAETFQQKKTQKEYLLKQILLLELLSKHAAEGYKLVAKGTSVVRDIKKGEFSLHDNFLGVFSAINPAIRNSVSVVDAIRLHAQILTLSSSLKTVPELYIRRVAQNAIKESWQALDQIKQLITVNALVLSDYERIKRCHEIYQSEQNLFQFLQKFSNDYKIYLHQKKGL